MNLPATSDSGETRWTGIPAAGPWAARFHTWTARSGNVLRPFTLARHIERLLRAPDRVDGSAAAALVRSVNLIVEASCNLGCTSCHYRRTRDRCCADSLATIEERLSLLDEVPQAGVAVTGGEPLLAPERAVHIAKLLLAKGRSTTLVTNSLPLVDPELGPRTKRALAQFAPAEKRRLIIRCSMDVMHASGSKLPTEDYVSACRLAIRFLAEAGFTVYTRSVVTTREDNVFFVRHVLPLRAARLTSAATVQPDMFNLRGFAEAIGRGELADLRRRLPSDYVAAVLEFAARPPVVGGSTRLKTAPWTLIEISAKGVRGPSAFLPAGAHHPSVLDMFRSYDWLQVSDAAVPQITLARNARPYRIDRGDRSVSVDLRFILRRLLVT